MSKILPRDLSVDFSMDGAREKSRMKEAANELASLISSLNLGNEESCIDEYVQLAWDFFVNAKYNMVELVDLAWGIKIYLGLDLNDELMEENDVDDGPTPIVKLLQACEYAQ